MPALVLLIVVLCVGGGLGMTWVAQGNHFFMYQFFAPRYEQVRRETFEQSKAYRQGMVQELQQMELDYTRANPQQKEALASVILQRTDDLDPSAVPPELWRFVMRVKNERVGGGDGQ